MNLYGNAAPHIKSEDAYIISDEINSDKEMNRQKRMQARQLKDLGSIRADKDI